MDFTYFALPGYSEDYLSSSVLPIPQAMDSIEYTSFFTANDTLLQGGIQEVTRYLDSAQNSTSFNRRIAHSGVKGDIHNQPLFPGNMMLMKTIDLDIETFKSPESQEQQLLCSPEALSILNFELSEEEIARRTVSCAEP